MPTRKAEAEWKGTLSKGKGLLITGSGAVKAAYSFASRFESGSGTNPEELIAAAHAGCFSMAFAGMLEQAGFPPRIIHTDARATIDKDKEGFSITSVELETEATVPRIDEKTFQEKAEAAKLGCPVSKALTGVKISLNARLMPSGDQ